MQFRTLSTFDSVCINFNWRSSNVGHHDGYLTRNDKYLVEKQSKNIYFLYILVLYVFDVVLRLLINSVFPNNTKIQY